MRKSFSLFFVFFYILSVGIQAQSTRFLVQFNNKAGTPYSLSNPLQFLTQRAIDRKAKYNIPIDSTDLPVITAYIDSVRLSGNLVLLNISKWMNQIYIQTTDTNALKKINSFPFVITTKVIAPRPRTARNQLSNKFQESTFTIQARPSTTENVNDFYSYGLGYAQIHLHNGEFLHNHGFRGEGKIIAVTDAGFQNYSTIHPFDSIRLNNQILGTWDFVSNNSDVNDYNHGTNCLSTIASNLPGTFIGTAPKASFYLYRTEDAYTEYHIEEYNWIASAERADSLGVDVISISLGYLDFDDYTTYTYPDMNGHTTIISKGVNIAARKGMLVLAANGNYGSGYTSPLQLNGNPIIANYHNLTTPGDADSVMAVGAVNTSGQYAPLSSHGPNSSGQVKPDVAAVGSGATISDTNGNISATGNGTSFACPITAGLSTCLWQAFPEVNNMSIIDAFRRSSDKFINPDSLKGYGIPNMKKAFVYLIKKLHTQQSDIAFCKTNINWSAKSDSTMNFVVERKFPADLDYQTLYTQNFTGGFYTRNCSYTDDLVAMPVGIDIRYRIKMNIAADTSFYLDSAVVNYLQTCVTYTFTGDGNWTDSTNWSNNTIPPDTLPSGSVIIIDPITDGECVLDKTQLIDSKSALTVKEGKKFRIPGELKIQ